MNDMLVFTSHVCVGSAVQHKIAPPRTAPIAQPNRVELLSGFVVLSKFPKQTDNATVWWKDFVTQINLKYVHKAASVNKSKMNGD